MNFLFAHTYIHTTQTHAHTQTLNIIYFPLKAFSLSNRLKINNVITGTIRYTIQYLLKEMALLLNQYLKIT